VELTKKDKKVARQIIEKGLQKEFEKGLHDADSILSEWKEKAKDNRESYHALYKTITDFDKHIARRYDGMSGSNYLLTIAAQLRDGVIAETDLTELSEDARQTILNFAGHP
jgi:hypothetical protein